MKNRIVQLKECAVNVCCIIAGCLMFPAVIVLVAIIVLVEWFRTYDRDEREVLRRIFGE